MLRQPYADRRHTGQVLADGLTTTLRPGDETVVLALPRGGVAVADPVAERLRVHTGTAALRR